MTCFLLSFSLSIESIVRSLFSFSRSPLLCVPMLCTLCFLSSSPMRRVLYIDQSRWRRQILARVMKCKDPRLSLIHFEKISNNPNKRKVRKHRPNQRNNAGKHHVYISISDEKEKKVTRSRNNNQKRQSGGLISCKRESPSIDSSNNKHFNPFSFVSCRLIGKVE